VWTHGRARAPARVASWAATGAPSLPSIDRGDMLSVTKVEYPAEARVRGPTLDLRSPGAFMVT